MCRQFKTAINHSGPRNATNCSGNGYRGSGVGIMKVYTYSEARQRFSEVLNIARTEEVIIKRRGGESFSIIYKKSPKSPFDVPGIKTRATTKDILDAIKESRSRS
jgi:prevent-host-death family protein